MSVTVIEETDQLADLTEMIQECAEKIAYKFKDWAEFDDLYQEGWLWALENRAQVDEWLASDQPGLVVWWLKKAMMRWVKKEKADRTGQSGEDEFFYSLPTLRRLLPIVLTSDGSSPHVRNDILPVSKKRTGYAVHGEFEAAWADIRAALRALRQDQRQLLWDFYVQERTSLDLAREGGVSDAVIRGRIRTALLEMQKELGGPRTR